METYPKHMRALGFARYLASCHVVAGHWYAGFSDFARWGFTWVPFFFIVSGFVLTFSRLTSQNPERTEPIHRFVWKRLGSVYPLFVLSLVMLLFVESWHGHPMSTTTWVSLPFSLLLMQAWTWHSLDCQPSEFTVCLASWNIPTWFLSCLFVYWIAWTPLYHKVRALSIRGTQIAMALCVLFGLAWPSGTFLLLGLHGSSFPWGEPLLEIAKFNPISYVHVFVFGMLLARLFVESEKSLLGDVCGRCGALAAYVILIAIFCALRDPFASLPLCGTDLVGNLTLLFRNCLLMPVHGLLVWGLAMERDPLAKLFSQRPLVYGGLISYPQYVLQVPVYLLVRGIFHDDLYNECAESCLSLKSPLPALVKRFHATSYLVLFLAASFSAVFVIQPYRKWWDSL